MTVAKENKENVRTVVVEKWEQGESLSCFTG